MLYRALLLIGLVAAIALNLNETLQAQRSQDYAESLNASASALDTPRAELATGAVPPIDRSASFIPHRVRIKRDLDLLRAPESDAAPSGPISRLTAGVPADAVDERGDWYFVETQLARGWVPKSAVEEP